MTLTNTCWTLRTRDIHLILPLVLSDGFSCIIIFSQWKQLSWDINNPIFFLQNFCPLTLASSAPSLNAIFPPSLIFSLFQHPSVPLSLLSPVSCSKVFLGVWRDSEALAQTGCSSAQGQCTGHGGEGEEGGSGERWTLYSQVRGGRQGQILRDVCWRVRVCACTFSCTVFVHMYGSCIDVSVLHSYSLEVNKQVQVSSALTCSYRWARVFCPTGLPVSFTTSKSHQNNPVKPRRINDTQSVPLRIFAPWCTGGHSE